MIVKILNNFYYLKKRTKETEKHKCNGCAFEKPGSGCIDYETVNLKKLKQRKDFMCGYHFLFKETKNLKRRF